MAASTYFDQVQQLYIAYFGRPADTVGLAYWAANIDAANGSVAGLIAGFSASNESQVLYAGATTAQKVSSIYLALFNRNPEAAGLAYWVAQIDSGTISQAQAAYQIQSSAGAGDATAVANKLAAAKAFTAQLDTTAEIAGYVGSTAASYGRAYLNGVDATPGSLITATSTTTLANTVAIATSTTTATTPVTPTTPTGQTFTLTAGADTIAGTVNNDTINSTVAGGFGTGDIIDGGAGTDRLTVTGSGSINSTGVTVSNVEVANFTSSDSVTLDTTGWVGLTSLTTQGNAAATVLTAGTGTAVAATVLNRGGSAITINGGTSVVVQALGSTTGNISVGVTTPSTGIVTISNTSTAAVAMGSISVKGGTAVNVTQTANNAVNTTTTMGSVTVTGTAATTTVAINNTARAIAGVRTAGVTDSTVTISDVNTGSTSTAVGKITDVTLSNYTNANINSNALTNLSLTGGSANIIIDNSSALTGASIGRTLNLTVNGLLGGGLIDQNLYTTLNVTTTGSNSTLARISDSALTTLNVSGSNVLTLTSASTWALQTVKVSGAAGLAADLSTGSATITSVDASGTSGNMTVSIDGTKATYSGGSGIDIVTLTGTPTKVITGGSGTLDIVKIDATAAQALTVNSLVSGFEQLTLTTATNQTVNVGNFVGVTTVSTAFGNGITLSGMISGETLVLTGPGTAYTVTGSGFLAGANDTLNLALSSDGGGPLSFAGNGVTADNIENIAITVSDTQPTPTGTFNYLVKLAGDTSTALTVSGNAGLTLNATSTGLTSVDASGITLGGFSWTAGNLTAAAATIKGSATGANIIDFSAATHAALTYTGGSGNDTVTLGAITGTASLNVGTGNDKLVLAGVATTSTGFAQVTGMTAGGGDVIDFTGARHGAANAGSLGTQLAGQTSLADYLNAAAAGDGSATATLKWFQFSGNTYIVQDTSASASFTAGSDTVVQLVGTINLSASTVAAGVLTL